MALTDKTLTCRDCGRDFIFTVGEQEFYLSRGLRNEPSRCPKCRRDRRQSLSGQTRVMHSAICAACGAETEVPFVPRQERPVYCSSCYTKVKR